MINHNILSVKDNFPFDKDDSIKKYANNNSEKELENKLEKERIRLENEAEDDVIIVVEKEWFGE